MEFFLQMVVNSLQWGSFYALIALGFVTIYNVTGIINFAQGGFVMLGAMLCVTFYELPLPMAPGLKLALAFILSVICVTIIGGLMERLTIYPARHAAALSLIIITVGAYITIQGLALLPRVVPWSDGATTISRMVYSNCVVECFVEGGHVY